MAVTYVGSLTAGQTCPFLLTSVGTINTGFGAALIDLQAKMAAALAVSIQPPQLITDVIQNLLNVIAALQALIASGMVITPPTIAASLTVIAELQLQISILQTGLSFAGDLAGTLATPGLHAYAYVGKAADLGSALGSALANGVPGGAGPNEICESCVLVASDGVAIDAMHAVLF